MKLAKYEHACFTLEKDGKILVVDPGGWTSDFTVPEDVVAVVVTHEHADHFDVNALGALVAHNPDAIIYAHEDITRQFGETVPHQTVNVGEMVEIGPFALEFFGGEHAVIHASFPATSNLGVMVNNAVYYPGDSFTKPGKPLKALALPVTAPWMKISEAVDFMLDTKPELVFPTHDAIASKNGKDLVDRLVGGFAEKSGIKYHRVVDPIEV